MTPWTLLLAAASLHGPAVTAPPPAPPAGAACLIGVRPRAWTPATTAAPAGAALRIDLDPEGAPAVSPALRPAEALRRTAMLESLQPEVLADGSLRLVAGDLLHSFSVLRLDASGRARLDCAHSAAEAEALVRVPAPARGGEDR